jgi:hypothetical protein
MTAKVHRHATPQRTAPSIAPTATTSAIALVIAIGITLCLACCPALASASTATPASAGCLGLGYQGTGCTRASLLVQIDANTPTLAQTNASETEEAEELEQGEGEETESAEAKAEAAGSAGSPSNPASGTSTGPSSGSPSNPSAIVSQLKLTSKATTALDRPQPSASIIEFSFMLSALSTVRVTLVRQTGGTERTRWTTLPDSLMLTAARGRVRQALTAHNRLSPGHYRLSVKSSAGSSRSIYLTARR